MKIIVRQCGFTGQLFKEDAAYLAHLQTLRAEQRENRHLARIKASFDADNAPLYQLKTIEEIEDWLNQNIIRIMTYHGPKWYYHKSRKRKKLAAEDTVCIKLKNMTFSKSCETTHSAPKGQRTTGWSNPHVPELGWKGRIEITFATENAYSFFDSDYLKGIGINTGSGGGGSTKLEYTVTLFAKDFPRMAGLQVYKRLVAE